MGLKRDIGRSVQHRVPHPLLCPSLGKSPVDGWDTLAQRYCSLVPARGAEEARKEGGGGGAMDVGGTYGRAAPTIWVFYYSEIGNRVWESVVQPSRLASQ